MTEHAELYRNCFSEHFRCERLEVGVSASAMINPSGIVQNDPATVVVRRIESNHVLGTLISVGRYEEIMIPISEFRRFQTAYFFEVRTLGPSHSAGERQYVDFLLVKLLRNDVLKTLKGADLRFAQQDIDSLLSREEAIKKRYGPARYPRSETVIEIIDSVSRIGMRCVEYSAIDLSPLTEIKSEPSGSLEAAGTHERVDREERRPLRGQLSGRTGRSRRVRLISKIFRRKILLRNSFRLLADVKDNAPGEVTGVSSGSNRVRSEYRVLRARERCRFGLTMKATVMISEGFAPGARL